MNEVQRIGSSTSLQRGTGSERVASAHDYLMHSYEPLAEELDFYSAYRWCLDPHLRIDQTVAHLKKEIERLQVVPADWQVKEVATNIVLLSCALLNALDEYLRGPFLKVPSRVLRTRIGRTAARAIDWSYEWHRPLNKGRVRWWRARLETGVDQFITVLAGESADRDSFVRSSEGLFSALGVPFPSELRTQCISIPSAFRRLDLTHLDILALGRRASECFTDRSAPVLVLGLRTAGTYFASLVQGAFKASGYSAICSLTVDAKRGPGRLETRALRRYAKRDYSVIITDDPPLTGETVLLALEIVRAAGFELRKVKVLTPTHAAGRNWCKSMPASVVIGLGTEETHKYELLRKEKAQSRIAEYFCAQNFVSVRVLCGHSVEEDNTSINGVVDDKRSARLKRIYEVELRTADGTETTQYVLAKSVGWGWLGYHAFQCGAVLSGFVPRMLGLRDGILYMVWLPQPVGDQTSTELRKERIDKAASYVAARFRALRLRPFTNSPQRLRKHDNGAQLLKKVLSRAYGPLLANTFAGQRVSRQLGRQMCPVPTLIDAKMADAEWLVGPNGPLKVDYEHHGMGKIELNWTDPAYDLADIILDLELSPSEEAGLLEKYMAESGDTGAGQRIYTNKLLAGLWLMRSAQENLFRGPRSARAQKKYHHQFMRAWNFLTIQTARLCGGCYKPRSRHWRSPIVALDVDGVLDRRLFGFPCTTAAGIEALSLLNDHGLTVVLNTARSGAEVREYCRAFGLAGGIAEHGSYLWDALNERERVLISPEALAQLETLRARLLKLPGIFVDNRHRFSIRAFVYEKTPAGFVNSLLAMFQEPRIGPASPGPVPTLLMKELMVELGLDRLSFNHTTIDTTIVADDTNKGTGLLALRDWVIGSQAETIAVGDSEADLDMFRVASRSFAPAQIGCAGTARLLGCRISRYAYQRGLYDIARTIASDQDRKSSISTDGTVISDDVFFDLLKVADMSFAKRILRTVFSAI
jgi:hydroxymethylpyrimidine pyrophosphatase-like HAD family hydrolase